MSRPAYVRSALDSSWLLQLAFLVAVLEVGIRIGLGRAVHPFLYLLAPPVAAVVVLGWFAPRIRTRVLGERRRYAVDDPDGVVARLLVVAVLGHAVAVVLGTAAFVLVDTPLRAVGYWLGFESRRPLLALAVPTLGVLAGTALAWTLPALVAAGVSEGLSIRRATTHALVAARDRSLVSLAAVHLLGVAGLVVAILVSAPLSLAVGSLSLFFALAGTLAVLLVTLPVAVAMLAHLGTVRELFVADADSDRTGGLALPTADLPVARLAVVLLLVVSLATLAGAARMAELRPMESPDAIGDDPDEMYATALENTLAGSYTVEQVENPRSSDRRAAVWQVDRGDRQLLWEAGERLEYASTGTQTHSPGGGAVDAFRLFLTSEFETFADGGPHSPPNYFGLVEVLPPGLALQDTPTATGWEVAAAGDGEIWLEMTDDGAVGALAAPDATHHDFATVGESRARAVIDRETGTLVSLDVRFEAETASGAEISVDREFTFDSSTDVERPEQFGDPSLEAYVWRLLVY